ncbi:MAG: tRNA pseudouridine(13) synthase TruD [Nitrososphaeria archaeon]|nr:tRNA pseudouridine(13) synthase TruD [Nitrososphaeria archaeon]
MVPGEDAEIGVRVYKTSSPPLTGRIKARLEDFAVKEKISPQLLASLRRLRSPTHRIQVYCAVRVGVDTLTLARIINFHSRIPRSRLRFLGLKDSRAVSSQIFSVVDGRKVPESIGGLSLLGWSEKIPSKESLMGNDFSVFIRNFEVSSQDVSNRLSRFIEELNVESLPNFYGYQRFGTYRRITHLVGKKIVTGEFKEAVMLYLTYTTPYEPEETRGWRKSLRDTGDLEGALKSAPKPLFYERKMLRELVKRPESYLKAIRSLPITLRRLFVNAFQSYLFNLVLSRRIREDMPITEPVIGDFVYDPIGSKIMRHRQRDRDSHHLMVAIPLFGYGYRSSEGRQGDIERDVLKEAAVTTRSFFVKEMHELSGKGGFRKADLDLDKLLFTHDIESNVVCSSFTLQRGQYATILLRELIKPSNPLQQGF